MEPYLAKRKLSSGHALPSCSSTLWKCERQQGRERDRVASPQTLPTGQSQKDQPTQAIREH